MKLTDRYAASGRPRPDPKTVCKGRCAGMGFYPTKDRAEWPPDAKPDEVGYVFVICHACDGTGRRDGKGKKLTQKKFCEVVRRIRRAIQRSGR